MSSSGAIGAMNLALPVAQVTDRRFFPQAGSSVSPATSAALGNGSLRLSPGYISSPVTVSQLGAEVTLTGDVGSTFLITVYRDAGVFNFPYPGALVASGSILGDSATVQETDVTDFLLGTGWWWFGGAVQNVTVTQPTLRTLNGAGVTGLAATSIPGAGGQFIGYTQGGVTGAAPANFVAFSANVNGVDPRVHLRLA